MDKISIPRFIQYWFPVIIYAVCIFTVSSVPGKDIPDLFPKQDILFHTAEYVIFALLISRAIKEYYPNQYALKRFLWVVALAIIYALTDEFHQSFVPYRTAAMSDVFIDGVGSLIGGLFYK